MVAPVPFIAEQAAQKGLRYEPDADERWLRAWEPYTTLKVPIRYEHTLQATGDVGSATVARFVVETAAAPTAPPGVARELGAWIAIVQDVRISAVGAATSDAGSPFGESLDLVTMPRRATGDAEFDRVFASFAPSTASLATTITPSLRKLVLGWRIPLHFELRQGGFVLAPVALSADPGGLDWFLRAIQLFGEKASKRTP